MNRNHSGQALVLAIAVLAIMFASGMAFYTLSQVEKISAGRYLESIRARYTAEAGVACGQKILSLDKAAEKPTDSLDDLTFAYFSGNEAFIEDESDKNYKWFVIKDGDNNPSGRFAVRISDEAAKININTSSQDVIERLFAQNEIGASKSEDLVENRPFTAIEDTSKILSKEEFEKLKGRMTVYSYDIEHDMFNRRRIYLNSAYYQNIKEGVRRGALSSFWQKALNLKDAQDADYVQSSDYIFIYDAFAPSNLAEAGGWIKEFNSYVAQAGAAPGKFAWFNLPVDDGEYFCFFYGPNKGQPIGSVYLQPEKESSAEPILEYGGGLMQMVEVKSGGFSLYIKPLSDQDCKFNNVRLVSTTEKPSAKKQAVFGAEAIVINELMVKPASAVSVSAEVIDPGETLVRTFDSLDPGFYYLRLSANDPGGLVGDVTANGKSASDVRDNDYFSSVIEIEEDGKLNLSIKNNSLNPAGFSGLTLSQEPDAEYIELLNISEADADLGGCYIEVYNSRGELVPGWPARIPEGAVIKPYEHLILALDSDDKTNAPDQLKNNKICFQDIWNKDALGLIFEDTGKTIDKKYDMLPNGAATVFLKSPATKQRMSAVEYSDGRAGSFISLERSDPAESGDSDLDGYFDNWYNSSDEGGGSPGEPNDNSGMYSLVDGQAQKHSLSESKVLNRPLNGLQEVFTISSGGAWERFSGGDLARLCDRFSIKALEFGLQGHYKEGDFKESSGLFSSDKKGETGLWEFNGISPGTYSLSIFSDNLDADNQLQVSVETAKGADFPSYVPLAFKQQSCYYGEVVLSDEDSLLRLKVMNDSDDLCSLQKIILEPVYLVKGRININTAAKEILTCAGLSAGVVSSIITNRPIGASDARRLGIGELAAKEPSVLDASHLLTVRSDVYEILSRGESHKQGKTQAYQIIRSVVERAN